MSSNYISRWEQRYREQGVEGLKLAYKGSQGYLSEEQRQAVIAWIAQAPQRNLWDVIEHIESSFGVGYRSLQSYYDLLKSSGMIWHQGQKKAPNTMNLWYCNTTK